jgi:hypothetical protein
MSFETDPELQAEYEKEAAELNAYTDRLEALIGLYDLYFTTKDITQQVEMKLPHSRNLWRRLGFNEEIKRLEATLAEMRQTKTDVSRRMVEAQKDFWKMVIHYDQDLYPFDPDHFELHMDEIEWAAFEL